MSQLYAAVDGDASPSAAGLDAAVGTLNSISSHSIHRGNMHDDPSQVLTSAEARDLRRLAGFMVPPDADFRIPGADDDIIFADIVRSLGRDRDSVRKTLALLRELAGGEFAGLDAVKAEAVAMMLLDRTGPANIALGRAVLQCYYRDDRVMKSLGLEPRPPFPKGHVLEQGDWSQIDAVRGRPRMWRDVDGNEA